MAFKRSWLAIALGLCALVLAVVGCASRSERGGAGILAGKSPSSVRAVDRAGVLTDGVASRDGDSWNTHRTAVFRGPGAEVVFDLGEVTPIVAVWLHGDNNDSYAVSVSNDGQSYQQLWASPAVNARGLRPRFTKDLSGSGRYLRITASGGDGSYALSEIQVFSELPAPFPPDVPQRAGYPIEERVRSNILILGLALLAFALLGRRGIGWWWAVLLALPVFAGWQLFDSVQQAWPLSQRAISLLRGTVAAVAGLIVLWETFAPERLMPDRRGVIGALGVCGVLGAMAFYNLGHPQFYDAKRGTWSFVHHLDLRQYHGTAKYFPEIGYWKLYEADVLAYSEDAGVPLDSIPNQVMRDLHTNRPSTVAERRHSIERIKERFSPERWEEYKKDARFFRETMGTRHWLETMVDLGGNATPVWIGVAYFLFNGFSTTHQSFLLMSLLDPLLFLILFAAVGRTFGLRTMAVVMLIFGANDFIMYGTNWGGAVLRHDWLVFLGLGICALRARRWVLAGISFGLATSIRAFPAFAVIGLCIPALWWIAEAWRDERKFPGLRRIIREQRPTFVAGLASVATVAVLVLLSSAVLGFSSWTEWTKKVDLLDAEPHVNPISLKTVIIGTDEARHRLLRARMAVYVAAVAAYVAMIVMAARKKRVEQAATLGLIFLPVLMFPANYYLHIVMLLPLVATDWHSRYWRRNYAGDGAELESRRPLDATDAWVWFSLLGICAVQYFTTLITELRLHFYLSSVVLVGGLGVMLAALVRRDGAELLAMLPAGAGAEAAAREPAPEPEPAASEAPEEPAGEQPEPRPAAAEAE